MVIPLKYQQNRFMQPQTTQYLHDISILRVAAMLMVVFYHCLCPYSIWKWTAYSIGFQVPLWETIDNMLLQLHLPIFFLISGYLYGCKRILGGGYFDTGLFVLGKTKRVLLPYLLVGVFLCLLQDRDMAQMLYGVSHLWFLVVIFECYMIDKVFDSVLWMKEK